MPALMDDPSDAELTRLLRRSLQVLPDVPPWATERAFAVWHARPPFAAPASTLLQRLQAALTFDSWQAQPGLAVRSRQSASRQLLYSVGGHDIDLRVVCQPGAEAVYEICGQVLGPATSGGAAWLPLAPGEGAETADAAGSIETALDDMGEFVIAGPIGPRGVLRLRLGAEVIDLPPLDLNPPGTPG